ncbi:hypothetical protein P7K49_035221 [Saguinus oedipus]|uniref:Uncharacterized protein n=1 Tax=Saguinus oedipus TaxID=9490 RepID=A0ABQ9TWY9_SAGOE|nr:hypothetical protein P7K49_035221 [Saguinus oedipus]
MGNGLRADVWKTFQQRFGPIRIWEIYGSTEGNMGLVNYVGRCGALGKMSCLLRMLSPFELVQFDMVAEEPVRDSHGFCIPVGLGMALRSPSWVAGVATVFSLAGTVRPKPRHWCSPDAGFIWTLSRWPVLPPPGASAPLPCLDLSL